MFALLLAALLNRHPAPLLLAHYMPWFESKPISGKWGWHWTMNHFNPDRTVGGRQEAASAYRPTIGLYDSSDPDLIEYHVLLMKISGLDGAILDWYGDQDRYDYLNNDRNSAKLIEKLKQAHMRFAILYEDQTVPNLISGGITDAAHAVENANGVMRRLEKRWFSDPGYVRVDGKPLFLVFGPQYYKDSDWDGIFAGLEPKPAFFTLMFRRGPAVGAYSWPTPQNGESASWKELDQFNNRAQSFTYRIDSVYPRFRDVYREAGLHGYPEIPDRKGETFERSLASALAAEPVAVQFATWNDWGEGTQIEPSVEFGFRDLERIQRVRRDLDGSFGFSAEDLRLPARLYAMRKRDSRSSEAQRKLDQVFNALVQGKVKAARTLVGEFD